MDYVGPTERYPHFWISFNYIDKITVDKFIYVYFRFTFDAASSYLVNSAACGINFKGQSLVGLHDKKNH